MARMYLLNTVVTPYKGKRAVFEEIKMTLEEAINYYQEAKNKGIEIVSAIGHQATSELMLKLGFDKAVFNRIAIFFEKGDEAIAIQLKQRLQEGEVINDINKIKELIDSFVLIRRLE